MQRHDSIELYSACRCVCMHTTMFTPLNFTYLNLGTGVTGIIVGGRPAPAGVICLPHRRHLALGGVISPHTQPAEGAQTRSSRMLCGVKPSSQIQRQLTTECL